MYWNDFLKIKKFTPIDKLFEELGKPMFKIEGRPIYYMGNGFLISYSPKMFKVENNRRVEYGDEGEYALSVYYFSKKQDLEAYFKITKEHYIFERDEFSREFEIIDAISMNSTYEQVTSYFREKSNIAYYQEGETRSMTDGKFIFQYNFVIWGNYIFFFFGKSKKTKVSGFQFTFSE